MNVILLSGGSGTRLWPLSNGVRSKQFLKVLRDSEGAPCSMVQRVYSQIERSGLRAGGELVVATGSSQAEEIRRQLGGDISVAVEPQRRDTMPAIELACAYLSSELGVPDSDSVVVLPIDSYVDDGYFDSVSKLERTLENADCISLLGVAPTYPSEKYGYIVPGALCEDGSYSVDGFVEKPSSVQADSLIANGALWNCGVFCFKLGHVLNLLKESLGTCAYEEVRSRYCELTKTSFDYGVIEKADSIRCISYVGSWKDLGTWNTLTEEMAEASSGNALLVDCSNVHAVNELGIPMLAMGLSDAVICATRDGIFVSDKSASAASKPYVEKIATTAPMTANRSWGEYEVLAEDMCDEAKSSVNRLRLTPGSSMPNHRHLHCIETWVVVDGEGIVQIDDSRVQVFPGSTVTAAKGSWHLLEAKTEMVIIEVRISDFLSDGDDELSSF